MALKSEQPKRRKTDEDEIVAPSKKAKKEAVVSKKRKKKEEEEVKKKKKKKKESSVSDKSSSEAEEEVEEEKVVKKKAIKIQLPRELKAQLVLDWEQITLEPRKWVPLPRSPTVREILDEFVEDRAPKETDRKKRWREFAEAIAIYFDKALPKILLYRYEREQLDLVKHLSPSSTYGAEHLLRLFAKLPELLVRSDLSASEVSQVRQKLNDLFNFLVNHRSRFFLPHYDLREAILGRTTIPPPPLTTVPPATLLEATEEKTSEGASDDAAAAGASGAHANDDDAPPPPPMEEERSTIPIAEVSSSSSDLSPTAAAAATPAAPEEEED